MTFEDPRQDRTALRLQLYENGFSPLPNLMKACYLPEWSKIKITPELIQSEDWVGAPRARIVKRPDTGLRCGEIIAIDWDVNDETLINELLDAVIEAGVVDESPFVRVGKPPRELWVYRTSDKIGKRTTGAFVRGEDEEEKVEILGGGCQFAAFGQRDEHTAYQWPSQSLLDAQYMDLPVITLAQVEALVAFAITFFERKGLDRRSPMAGTDGGYNHEYDLTPDMVFDISEMGELSVEEIGGYLRLNPNDVLRCRVDALRPTSGSWAGMISLVHDAVCVSDHGTYTSHFPAEASLDDATSKLGALLAPRIAAAEEAAKATPPAPEELFEPLSTYDDFDTNMVRALRSFVFVKQDAIVYDIGNPVLPWYKVREFKDQLTGFYTTKVGSKGGEQTVWLYDQWSMHRDRIIVARSAMRPDMPRPFFTEDGVLNLNTYRPPVHVATYGSAAAGIEMLDGLLPVPEERAYFKQWLRFKIENPAVPGIGIVMVAHRSYGTGRGSLFELLSDVFGSRYTTTIDFDTLTGRTSQSQYTEWREDNVLVMVDEALENGGKWVGRINAYEAIKKVVDPASKAFTSTRKGLKNDKAISYNSMIVATNHANALVIPDSDRRLAILENGPPRSAEYWTRFHAWRANPANVAAFVNDILTTDMTGFMPYAAPLMTRAKAEMIEHGESDLDRAVREVIEGMEGAVVVKEQVTMHLEDYLRDNAVDFPDGWEKTAHQIMQNLTRKIIGADRMMIEGRQRNMRALGVISPEMVSDPAALRAELDKNGPVSRTLKSGGKVVNFPQR